ncbi:MAG: hypothetical protein QGG53_16765 [Planctomycetota bacterium]|jgi:hypothetical protein|nr:hypothetical protein [Planctomycetota bacterium]
MSPECQLSIDAIRKVFDDDNHNAFTDLCWFQDRIYLTFRSCPDGHGVFSSSWIVVLRSDDGGEWQQMFTFSVSDRDVRDPHFLEFNDTLFVYTGTWLCDPSAPGKRDMNDHLGYGAWSTDGENWEGPRLLEGTYGHYVWRAAVCRDQAFLCGRRKREFAHDPGDGDAIEVRQGALLESNDGLVWKTAGLFTEAYGNETAFLFEDDGSLLALARGGGSRPAKVCRSRPPFSQWGRVTLDRNVGGPLLAKWGDRYLVGGRKTIDPQNPKTTLYWLADDELEEIAELPSGGDNSYPGFVPFSDSKGLLSYYSSHEVRESEGSPTSIYLADLSLK